MERELKDLTTHVDDGLALDLDGGSIPPTSIIIGVDWRTSLLVLCLCSELFVDVFESTLNWIMLSMSVNFHLEISMNISINYLMYLSAGTALAGGSGDMFPRSREAFHLRMTNNLIII